MLRVVLDTNVLVSSLLSSRGAPAEVMDAWREARFVLLMSPSILRELLDVLHRPRIQVRYGLHTADIDTLAALLERYAVWVPGRLPGSELMPGGKQALEALPEDPQDLQFLLCAVEGGADAIVSGDEHLLALRQRLRIPIWTPREFLARLTAR